MGVKETSFSKDKGGTQPGNVMKKASYLENINMKIKDENGEVKQVPTKYYGNIEFINATRRSLSKFVRCADDTDPANIYELMVKHWEMEKPSIVINVGGGPESFALDPVVKQNLVVALSKVGETTGCWVVSTGINTGVMRYIGEALQGLPSTVGIMGWNELSNIKDFSLSDPGQQDSESEPTYAYKAPSWLAEKGRFLDNNHSHFLLVDDGIENQSDEKWDRSAENTFKDNFMTYLFVKKSVSMIHLAMHGRPKSIEIIYEIASRGIPVVIVEKSGGTVDCLVYALNASDEIQELQAEEGENGEKIFHEGLYRLLEKDKKKRLREEDWAKNTVEQCYSKIVECLDVDVKKNIFVFSDSNSDVFMEAFMEAFRHRAQVDEEGTIVNIVGHRTTDYRQVELTLSWNRADLAREKIFGGMVEWHGNDMNDREQELFDLTIIALAMNNAEMVKLMLENGVSLNNVDSRLLEFLYGYRSHDTLSPLRYLFTKSDHAPLLAIPYFIEKYGKYYEKLKSIDKKAFHVEPEFSSLARSRINKLLNLLCKDIRTLNKEIIIEESSFVYRENKGRLQYPYRELFFWAVLNNMKEMALVLWPLKDDHMMKALIAAHVCDKLREKMGDRHEIVRGLAETATELRQSSLRLLDVCHLADPDQTKDLLTSSFEQFKGLKIRNLVLADASLENLDFISHDAVQAVIIEHGHRQWTGDLYDTNVSYARLLISWLIPPLIFTLKFRRKSEPEEKAKDDSDISVEDDKKPLQKSDDNFDKLDKLDEKMSACDPKKISAFYGDIPVVKFLVHAMGYFAFLVFLSHSVMTKQTEPKLTWLDWLILVTVLGYAVSEIYQMLMVDAPSIRLKMKGWANSVGCQHVNMSDVIVIALYFIALGLRLHQKTMDVGHLIYAIDVGLWWLRILPMLLISPTLGPYLVMIRLMLKDLMTFLCMLLIFIVCYGVVSTSILEPHEAGIIDINRLRNIFWKPYFNIYGELFTESEAETNKTRFGTPYQNVYDETLMWILLAVYLLFGNVLLLNLLIAIFGDRYGEVKGKSNAIWKYARISLYIEFSKRIPLFPPFSLIHHFCLLLIWIFKRLRKISCTCSQATSTVEILKKKHKLIKFESDCMASIKKEDLQSSSKSAQELSKDLLKGTDDMKSFMMKMDEKIGAVKTRIDKKLIRIEKKLKLTKS